MKMPQFSNLGKFEKLKHLFTLPVQVYLDQRQYIYHALGNSFHRWDHQPLLSKGTHENSWIVRSSFRAVQEPAWFLFFFFLLVSVYPWPFYPWTTGHLTTSTTVGGRNESSPVSEMPPRAWEGQSGDEDLRGASGGQWQNELRPRKPPVHPSQGTRPGLPSAILTAPWAFLFLP